MTRRRLVPLLAVVLGSLVVAVAAAWAGFPNIQRFDDPVLVYGPSNARTLSRAAAATSAGAFSDPRVFVGGIVITDVDHSVKATLSASYSATYVCVRNGVPSTTNAATLVGHITTSAVFPEVQNHRAKGSLLTPSLPSAAHAAAQNGFTCPTGQTLEFDRAVFSHLVLAAAGGERVELHVTLASHPVYG